MYNYLNDKNNDLEEGEKEQLKNDISGIEDEIKGLISINNEGNKKTSTIKKFTRIFQPRTYRNLFRSKEEKFKKMVERKLKKTFEHLEKKKGTVSQEIKNREEKIAKLKEETERLEQSNATDREIIVGDSEKEGKRILKNQKIKRCLIMRKDENNGIGT